MLPLSIEPQRLYLLHSLLRHLFNVSVYHAFIRTALACTYLPHHSLLTRRLVNTSVGFFSIVNLQFSTYLHTHRPNRLRIQLPRRIARRQLFRPHKSQNSNCPRLRLLRPYIQA